MRIDVLNPAASDQAGQSTSLSVTATQRGADKFPEALHLCPPRFDKYQVTIPKDISLEDLYELFIAVFDGIYPWSIKSPQKQYPKCEYVSTERGTVLFFHGGSVGNKYGINMCATGHLADDIAKILRKQDCDYGLSQAHICQDHRGDYEERRDAFIMQAKRSRLRKKTAYGEPVEGGGWKNQSIVAGGEKSRYQVIFYEKGKQLGGEYPEDYLRLEHKFRPKSHEKKAFAKMTAAEILSSHKAARGFSAEITGRAFEAYEVVLPPREKDPFKHMLIQGGKPLFQFLNSHGPCQGGQILWEMLAPKHASESKMLLH